MFTVIVLLNNKFPILSPDYILSYERNMHMSFISYPVSNYWDLPI
jgi:hypothetical protein